MAIDQQKITTDITLELDEDEISVGDFAKAFEHFFGLVKEVTKAVVPGKNPGAWLVRVYEGSAGVGLAGTSEFSREQIAVVGREVLLGLEHIERGERSTVFSDKAYEHIEKFSQVFKSKPQPGIRIWKSRERALPLKREMSARAGELLSAAYEEPGSVEGVLEKLEAHGKFVFVVYDVLDQRSVKCEVSEDLLKEAWAHFRERVEVVGSVKYRKDGIPVSVKAARIIPFPPKDKIPTLEQMRKLLN